MLRYANLGITALVVLVGTSIGCGQDAAGDSAASAGKLVPVAQNTGDTNTPDTPTEAGLNQRDASAEGPALQGAPLDQAQSRQAERPTAPAEDTRSTDATPPTDVPALAAGESAELAALRTEIADLKARIAALEKSSTATSQSVEGIVEKLSQIDGRLQKQIDNHADRLAAISQQDGNRYVPSLLGNMQNSDRFRHEVARAVQGQVVIDNRTGGDQQIYINGTLWRAPAGKSETRVPFGPVTTQLVPWENQSKQWTLEQWKATDDGQQLEIVIGY